MQRLRRPAPVKTTEIIEYDSTPVEVERTVSALVAAAAQVQLDEGAVMRRRISDEEWQREAWRQYDITGELRFAANRHAGALSQCRLYVAELDDSGHPGKEAEDPKVARLIDGVFGGPAKKAEYLRTLDIQLYVGGESWIIAESAARREVDIWYCVTPGEIKSEGVGKYKVKRPEDAGGGWHVIDPKRDLMMRVWTPHPRKYDLADSSVRSTLPVLREIERLSMLTFSQIDSRLISAGLLLLPQNVSFPKPDGTPGNISNLLEMILTVAQAQLNGAGTAAGLVPILAEIPPDTGKDIQHIKFETALTNELKDKLDHAIRRLATGLDIDPQELLGMGDSNHWSAWQIDENGIKLFIQPPMIRICDAINRGYLEKALKSIGADPAKYTIWFDPSPLTVRPNRFEDAVELFNLGELSGERLREAGNFTEDDKMEAKELADWRLWKLLQLKPDMLSDPVVAKLVGLPVTEPPGGFGGGPELPPGQDQGGQDQAQADNAAQGDQNGRALPSQPNQAQSDGGALTAALLPGAEQVVLRALEMAGGRMLDRHSRGRFGEVERFALHTRIPATGEPSISRERADGLLSGAFSHVPALAAHHGINSGELSELLHQFCVELITRRYPYSTELLREMLERARA
jgi:hypothetical protein